LADDSVAYLDDVSRRTLGLFALVHDVNFNDCAPTQLAIAHYGNRHSRSTKLVSHPLENHPAQIDAGQALLAHQNAPYFRNGRKLL
jgi:hypothetical protein